MRLGRSLFRLLGFAFLLFSLIGTHLRIDGVKVYLVDDTDIAHLDRIESRHVLPLRCLNGSGFGFLCRGIGCGLGCGSLSLLSGGSRDGRFSRRSGFRLGAGHLCFIGSDGRFDGLGGAFGLNGGRVIVLDDNLFRIFFSFVRAGFDHQVVATWGDFNLVGLFLHGSFTLESCCDNIILFGGKTGVGVGLNLMTLLGQKLHQCGYTDIQFGCRFLKSYSFVFFCHITLLFLLFRTVTVQL